MISASFVVHGILVDFGQSFDTHEKGLFRLGSGTFRLLTVDFLEHGFQLFFESLVLGALVEFADKMTSNFEGVIGEIESGATQVLKALVSIQSSGQREGTPCCQRDL